MTVSPCGRFAPSPSGPLHLGSLVAAVGSFLEARRLGGRWLVRIEDVDTPRVDPGAADAILHVLESLGLHWDGAVRYQSEHFDAYAAALEQLRQDDWVYPCSCSRRHIMAIARRGSEGWIYPGTCRNGPTRPERPFSWRVRTDDEPIEFHDDLRGKRSQRLASAVGDFVLRRADGVYAYQLAVVVDDAAQGITHVVRGLDLLDNTPRQIHLQRLLGYPRPDYAHLPLVLGDDGHKLSKQTGAPAVDPDQPVMALWQALHALNQHPPLALQYAKLATLWDWAYTHWHPWYGVRNKLR